MIELNLLDRPKALKIPVVMGIDLKKINIPLFVISMIVYFVVPDYIKSYYDNLVNEEVQVEKGIVQINAKIEDEIKKQGASKDELELYSKQIEEARVRSLQIDEILKTRTNPKKILEVFARIIPDEVSFQSLSIDLEDNILIKGESNESRAIGDFIAALNDTPYFGGSITPIKQESKIVTINGKETNIDTFELKGNIKNYDMRLK